jgi:FixJ family two-component response regulator
MTGVVVKPGLILEAMARLTPAQREVICRSYYQAQTTAQIANELNIDKDTVKSRLHFGVQALLRSLEEHGGPPIEVHHAQRPPTMHKNAGQRCLGA